jgi:hypothetical protein
MSLLSHEELEKQLLEKERICHQLSRWWRKDPKKTANSKAVCDSPITDSSTHHRGA